MHCHWKASSARHALSAEGRFDRSLVPVVDESGKVVLAKDEYPRPQTTAADLAALEPSFSQNCGYAGPRR